ncbi:unnamed protein product [Darwinula stevensoni]|uniref:LIM zinc-binding domain-containing protein n=1 Tax=Darwinula stevensoni TaxID=69355 RepID=A0A7R8XE77_9CRUS|nr:unnamed protein product [Darwinula stevensoni]CAG0895518.1 unnamed protein product [Darwinula stevensoni]
MCALFGSSGLCGSCGQTIPASEFVMRSGCGGVYHLKCFACSKCGSPLVTGDRYALVNGSLLCEQDSLKVRGSPGASGPGGTGATRKGKVGRPRRSRD